MSYLESLVEEVNNIFDQNGDIDEIRGEVLALIQNKSIESFKNGLEAARKKLPVQKKFKKLNSRINF
jgi:hypothetical protein